MAASRKIKKEKTLLESSNKYQMCSACLCVTRPAHKLDDVLFKCYMGILLGTQLVRHVRLSNNPRLCWECRSVLRRWIHFRKQVKESFEILHSAREQKVLSSTMKHPGRLESRFLFSMNIVPGECNDVSTVMTACTNDDDDLMVTTAGVDDDDETKVMAACGDDDDSLVMIAGVDNEDGLTVMISDVDDDDESKVMAACSDDDDSTVITACSVDDDDLMVMTAGVDEHDYCELLLGPVKKEDECETEHPTGELTVDNLQTTIFIEPFEPVDDEDDNADVETSSKTSSKITYEEKLPFPRKEVVLCSDRQCKKCSIGKKLCIIDTADKQVKCDKLRSYKSDLDLHKIPVKKPFEHELCQNTYTRKGTLANHMRYSHDKQLKYECDFCKKSFFTKRNRAAHATRWHPDILYECDECHERFTRKLLLRKHINNLHTKFICPLCYKVFQSYKMLCTHLKTHPGKLFQCHKCHKKFNLKTDLNRHMVNHSKNYLCDICSKAFVLNSTLRIHMKIHNGENPYKCKLCPNTFKTSWQLIRHKRTGA